MSHTNHRIVSAQITAMPRALPEGMSDPLPSVVAVFDDGAKKVLFSFYPDEIEFCPLDFIGLTEREAQQLKFKRDVSYIRGDTPAPKQKTLGDIIRSFVHHPSEPQGKEFSW